MDIYDDIFERRSNTPLWWYNKSSDLHASAGVLWLALRDEIKLDSIRNLGFKEGFSMHVACWPVYQMLCGYSLELIFKAIILGKGSQPSHEHQLNTLAKTAELDYSELEMDILKILTESIIWDGRYPTPKKKEQLEKHYKHTSEVLLKPLSGEEKLKFRRPDTSGLQWESYSKMRQKAVNEFFSLM